MITTSIDSAFAAFDQAETDIMDAIRARNIAVGKHLPLPPHDLALARARASLDAAVTLVESTGSIAPKPFAHRPTPMRAGERRAHRDW